MRLTTLLRVVGPFLLAGCQVGPNGQDLQVARQASGATALVQTSSGTFSVELVAVQDDGILLSHGKLFLAPLATITSLRVENVGYRLEGADLQNPATLTRLRLVSHFPQGLTPEIQKRLLAQFGQTEVEGLR